MKKLPKRLPARSKFEIAKSNVLEKHGFADKSTEALSRAIKGLLLEKKVMRNSK